MSSFEDLLLHVGSEGQWQWRVFLFGTMGSFFCAMHNLGAAFLASTPQHWCTVPGLPRNWFQKHPELRSLVLPSEQRHSVSAFSQCTYYDHNYGSIWSGNQSFDASQVIAQFGNNSDQTVVTCDQWIFDDVDPRTTVVTEWQLVCNSKGLAATIQATYMVGALVGSIVVSTLADRCGRRTAFIISLIIFLASAVGAAFSPSYLAFVILRLFTAVGLCGIFIAPYIVVTEITGSPKLRSFFGILFNIPFAAGYMALPGFAYYLRHWSSLQLAMTIPGLVLICMIWFVPESPRWLITKGRFNEALRILRHGADVNRKQLPSDNELLSIMKTLKKKEEVLKADSKRQKCNFPILELCTHKRIRTLTLIVYFTWFTVAMVYYGLALNTPQMSSNPYLVFFAAGAVEIPAYALTFGAVQWAGRRRSYAGTFLVAGLACLAILLVPMRVSWLRATLAILGKFSVTATFAISYLYTAELFPTEIRSMAVGYGSVFARFGSISAPYIVDLLGAYHDTIPMTVFGTLSIGSAVLSCFLPETEKADLPDSIAAIASMKNPKAQQSPDILEISALRSKNDEDL